MPVTTSYPGVYIEELSTLSLSVASGATAVPAFAYMTSDSGVTALNAEVVKITSWLTFTKIVGDFDPKSKLHVSLRSYFENGGGYCYLVPLAKLADEIPKLDDVTLLVAAGQDIGSAASTLCQPGASLFAILDGPTDELTTTVEDHGYAANAFLAVYYPWLLANWAEIPIPPSAPVAGAYAQVDRNQGVWKTPANIALQGGLTPQFKVTDDVQGVYNTGLAINMIRTFASTGTTVWGGRTLDDTDEWRYVAVRRLFNTAERDIKRAMSTAVFEPNSQPTWERVRTAIESYLYGIWRRGGLAGSKESDAYFVHIGKDITMTEDDISQGRMIAEIGMAAVRPAEFIILQFTQKVGMV